MIFGLISRKMTILLIGLLITFSLTLLTHIAEEKRSEKQFRSISADIHRRIITRLRFQEQMLKAASSFFHASDSVERKSWNEYIYHSSILENLPGMQAIGFSILILPEELEEHTIRVRMEGFPEYVVQPAYNRDFYTSVMYIEPFTGSQKKLMGFDMFSEPVRRKAMELARDSNLATISGKVRLNQDTCALLDHGCLMFFPVYEKGKPVSTPEQRRAALQGWVFSPYRLDDLIRGLFGGQDFHDQLGFSFRIFDDNVSKESLLFESQNTDRQENRFINESTSEIPLVLNGKTWILQFSREVHLFKTWNKDLIVLISGIVISFLIHSLYLSLLNTNQNARKIAADLTRDLKENEKQLKQINATRDKLLSIIAHDLRSPFNAILGLTVIIEDNLVNKNIDKAIRLTRMVNASAEQTLIMLENLLDWARNQTGEMLFQPKFYPLHPVMDRALSVLYMSASVKNISLKYHSSHENLCILADLNMFEIVLRNLVSNAIKFTNPGGKIDIHATFGGDEIEISVEDNGIGMRQEMLDNMFSIDAKISRNGTSLEKGSGLGLILCRELIEKNGGKISVKSVPGQGSRFMFSLPGKTLVASLD